MTIKRGFWMVPPMWAGETVYLLGGGPSLAQMDLSRLKGEKVIGINNAWELFPDCQITYFGDMRWWSINSGKIANYGGLVVSDLPHAAMEKAPRVLRLIRDERPGIQWKFPNRLMWCKSSGATAIGLAVLLGAAKVVLLGFDMRVVDGGQNKGHNWHNNHMFTPNPTVYEERFLPHFGPIKTDLERMERETGRKVEVVNATPGSALTLFPFVSLEAA